MEELVRIAEHILSGVFGRHAALLPERAWDGDKSTVLRCRLLYAAPPAPPGYLRPSAHGAKPKGPDPRVQKITANLLNRFRAAGG